jgi:enoyl-CoA hydratase/carnithine racemase
LAATKRLLTQVPGMPTQEAFDWTAKLSADLFRSDEAIEGMRAYLEKRSPDWAG